MHRQTLFMTIATAVAILSGCAKKEAPPAADMAFKVMGWGSPKSFPRKDEAGVDITVNVEMWEAAIVVSSSTPPTSETLLARFTNYGDAAGAKKGKEKTYKFDTDDKVEYLLYALPSLDSKTGTTAWEFREKSKRDGNEKKFAKGGFGACENFHPSGAADAGFKHCPLRTAAQAKTKRASLLTGGYFGWLSTRFFSLIQDTAMKTTDTDPAWVSCTDGCCTLTKSET